MTAQSSDIAIESVVIMKNDLPSPAGNEGKVLAVEAGVPAWVDPAIDTNDKVRASSADTTPGYLEPKLEAGDNVSLSISNPGADEKVRIDVAVPPGLDEKVKVSATDTTPGFLQNKLNFGTGIIASLVNPGADESILAETYPLLVPTGNLLLSVNAATGTDTPSEDRPEHLIEGDYTAFPFATIQAAIDAVPDVITGATTITVQAGFYPAFKITGKRVVGYPPFGAGLYVYGVGVLQISTGTTNAIGTIDTIIDTTKSWTPNEWRGKRLWTSYYGTFMILSNTATSITVLTANYEPFPAGMGFAVEDNGVEVEAAEIYECKGGYGGIGVQYMNVVLSDLVVGYCECPVSLQNMYVSGGGSLYVYSNTGSIGIGGTALVDSFDGIKIVLCKEIILFSVLVIGGGDYGGDQIAIDGVHRITLLWDVAAIGGLQNGISFGEIGVSPLYPPRLRAADNAKNGVFIREGVSLGTVLTQLGSSAPFAVMEGSGNGEHGIRIEAQSGIIFDGVPTITGSLGDFTLDRGSTVGVWATAFASPGIVANSQMLNRLERLT